MKQIYPVKRWDSREKKEVMSIQTSIDGFRIIAERTGKYSPGKEPIYVCNGDRLVSCTAYVKKMTIDGTWHEVAATAFYDEYVQKTKEGKVTSFWDRMPRVMLAKCAESMALRKAFPAELSGMYTSDEMSQATAPSKIEVEMQICEDAPKSADLEEYKKLLLNHIDIPSPERLIDYLDICKKYVEKTEKDLQEVTEGWIDEPHKFLAAYNKWLLNKKVNNKSSEEIEAAVS